MGKTLSHIWQRGRMVRQMAPFSVVFDIIWILSSSSVTGTLRCFYFKRGEMDKTLTWLFSFLKEAAWGRNRGENGGGGGERRKRRASKCQSRSDDSSFSSFSISQLVGAAMWRNLLSVWLVLSVWARWADSSPAEARPLAGLHLQWNNPSVSAQNL